MAGDPPFRLICAKFGKGGPMRAHDGGSHPTGPTTPSTLWLDKYRISPHLCRSAIRYRQFFGLGLGDARRINSQVIGASDAAKPAEAGRMCAEWCPTRAMVRRSSWPGRRRRAGGGVMATGHQVVPGAPTSADDAAAGPPMTAENATRPGWPDAAWPVSGAQPGPASGSPGYELPPHELVEHGSASRPSASWRGSGGRWLLWVFRVVLWAVLLLIGYRGVAAIVMGDPGPGSTSAAPPAASNQHGDKFPVALAEAYALQFGQVYLNFNQASAAQRSRGLAAFLPPGSDPTYGWNGAGAGTLQSEQVAGIRIVSTHRAVVTLLARVNGGLTELAVPIYANGSRMVVSGYPALLPAPAQASPPRAASARLDLATGHTLRSLLPAFFRAYASSDTVRPGALTASGRSMPGLGGSVRFAGIGRLRVAAAAGDIRRLTVTVIWKVGARPAPGQTALVAPPPELRMTYAMTVVRHRASWLVRSMSASAVQPWPAP